MLLNRVQVISTLDLDNFLLIKGRYKVQIFALAKVPKKTLLTGIEYA